MRLLEWALVALAAGVVGLNAHVTWRLTRSVALTNVQKFWHLLFVWAVPIVGAIIVRNLVSKDRPAGPPRLDEQERPETNLYVTQALGEHARIAARVVQSAAGPAVVSAVREAMSDPTVPDD